MGMGGIPKPPKKLHPWQKPLAFYQNKTFEWEKKIYKKIEQSNVDEKMP